MVYIYICITEYYDIYDIYYVNCTGKIILFDLIIYFCCSYVLCVVSSI